MVLAQRLEEPKVLQKPGREGWKLKPTPLVGDTRREKAEEGEMEAEERQSSLDRFSKKVFRFGRINVQSFNLCLTK